MWEMTKSLEVSEPQELPFHNIALQARLLEARKLVEM